MYYYKIYIYGAGISQTFFGQDYDATVKAIVMAKENEGRSVTVEKDNVKMGHYHFHNGRVYYTNQTTSETEILYLGLSKEQTK